MAHLMKTGRGQIVFSAMLNLLPYVMVLIGVILGQLHPAYLAVMLVLPVSVWLIGSLNDFVNHRDVAIEPKNITCVSSYTHAVEIGNKSVIIGERINPTGKKKLKEALRNGDMNYILTEAVNQAEKGVHILDVNVGLPEIDEKAMMYSAVTALQSVTDLPLQIDTAKASIDTPTAIISSSKIPIF